MLIIFLSLETWKINSKILNSISIIISINDYKNLEVHICTRDSTFRNWIECRKIHFFLYISLWKLMMSLSKKKMHGKLKHGPINLNTNAPQLSIILHNSFFLNLIESSIAQSTKLALLKGSRRIQGVWWQKSTMNLWRSDMTGLFWVNVGTNISERWMRNRSRY